MRTKNDDMVEYYSNNPDHYRTGLTRIGCSVKQALNYSSYFDEIRGYYQKFIINIARSYFKDRGKIRIFDVGCGMVDDILSLDKKLDNVEFYGHELSSETISLIKEKLDKTETINKIGLYSGDLKDLNDRFDLIINFCVLEHVGNTGQFFKEMAGLLKDDGLIIMSYPNYYYMWYWNFILLPIFRLMGKKIKPHAVDVSEANEGISQAGLRTLYFETYGYRPPQDNFSDLPESSEEFSHIKNRWWNINHSFQLSYWQKFLYLHLCVLAKSKKRLNFKKNTFSKNNIYFLEAFFESGSYQLKKLFRGIIKRVYRLGN